MESYQSDICRYRAICVVTGTWKFDRGLGQILHDELHWLDVPDRVFFKLAVTVHRCLNGGAPAYLSDYCVPPPVSTLGSTCVPPTVNCLQYLATGSTLTAVGPFQLPAPQSGTLSGISKTRPSVQTLSDVCLKRINFRGVFQRPTTAYQTYCNKTHLNYVKCIV